MLGIILSMRRKFLQPCYVPCDFHSALPTKNFHTTAAAQTAVHCCFSHFILSLFTCILYCMFCSAHSIRLPKSPCVTHSKCVFEFLILNKEEGKLSEVVVGQTDYQQLRRAAAGVRFGDQLGLYLLYGFAHLFQAVVNFQCIRLCYCNCMFLLVSNS